MAKAHKAPYEGYRQRRFITPHAIQRFRERAASWLEREGILEDRAAAMALDRAIEDAFAQGAYVRFLDESALGSHERIPTMAVTVDDPERFQGAFVAIVRNARGDGFSEAVVTLLTMDMALANRASGAWRQVDGTTFPDALTHRPLGGLANVKLPAPAPAPESKPDPKPDSTPEPAPAPAPTPAPALVRLPIEEALRAAAQCLKPFMKAYRGTLVFTPSGFTFTYVVEPVEGRGSWSPEDL